MKANFSDDSIQKEITRPVSDFFSSYMSKFQVENNFYAEKYVAETELCNFFLIGI